MPDFADAVVKLTGGRGDLSIDSLRHDGRLVAMGSHPGRVAEVQPVGIHRKEIDIRGAHTRPP
ncbi:hypothetical protein [Amycolatopsis jejuensis]|uniref:hypothetical protein n=1 Tax=Amycolatopsis jejuensis TaxID=330084 RepID=UPI0005244A51|nr:hypothetical protein [Amycolatopsis jejuensis]